MDDQDPSDGELVQRCLEEDRQAWETLVKRYGRLVYALALRAGLSTDDAADVFQMVFLTAYRNLHLLDRPESLPFWLSTIARRESWQASRKAGRRAPAGELLEPEAGAEGLSPAPLADEELERVERAGLVHRALDSLDERCRRLLRLLFFEEPAVSYEDAARSLEMPLGSIGPTRARCLEKLGSGLKKLGF